MALNRVQLVRHDTAGADAFTGKVAELTVNTSVPELRLHDELLKGGHKIANADLANVSAATAGSAGKMTAVQVQQLDNHESRLAVNESTIAQNTSDIATNASSISSLQTGKLDKLVGATSGHVAVISSDGGIQDGGFTPVRMDAGTKAVFVQASAPNGWTLDVTHNDRVLRLNNSGGGGIGGNWGISGLTVQGYALQVADLPAFQVSGTTTSAGGHSHEYQRPNVDGSSINPGGSYSRTVSTGTTDTAGQHSHSFTSSPIGGDQPHSHGITSSGAWRPSYLDIIVCTRNAP